MNCHPGAREPEPAAQRRPDPAAATRHQRDLAGKNGTGIAHPDPFFRPPSIGKATASLGVTKATLSITTTVTTGVNLHGGRAQIEGGRGLEGCPGQRLRADGPRVHGGTDGVRLNEMDRELKSEGKAPPRDQ